MRLFLPYVLILSKVEQLIVGESGKLKRYKFLAPFNSKTIIGYHPIIKYFNYTQPDLLKENIILGFAI
ncbi:MAG: hypothetical protein MUP85_01710 [Candidatus Lokiarchaeota archaeon]|nr:hypothetical protein [Candidatus Lokiarchaeota archaeon]